MKTAWILATALTVAGCGTATRGASATHSRIRVTSPAFVAGGRIPPRFTCQGKDVSPPLGLSGVPGGSGELDLVMRDPDAPGGGFTHWRLTGIPASTRAIGAGQVPAGAKAGRNDFGSTGYGGPCPPPGPAHHYVITVTARAGTTVLASGTLVGTYARR